MAQPDNSNSEYDSIDNFVPGRLVEVKSRMWPGMNKPGGVARVSMAHFGTDEVDGRSFVSHVDVHFVVGRGKEKRVPIEYVTPAPQYESGSAGMSTLRDRSMLLGRCRRCGSLRTDCGSCDWAAMEQQHDRQPQDSENKDVGDRRRQQNSGSRRRSGSKQIPEQVNALNDEGSSDEDELLIQTMLAQNKRRYRQYLRKKARWVKLGISSSSSSSSSDEGDGDFRGVVNVSSRDKNTKTSSSSVVRRKNLSSGSVLETLGNQANPSSTRERRIVKTEKEALHGAWGGQSAHKKGRRRRVSRSNNSDGNVVFTIESSPESLVGNSGHLPSSGDEGTSSAKRVLMSESVDSSRQLPRFTATNANIYGESDSLINMSGRGGDHTATISLSQFIQPEGDEAAQNLPKDIVDRTKSIKYGELPQFFDKMASRIEVELLPSAKLKVAELQRDWADLQRQAEAITMDKNFPEQLSTALLAVSEQCNSMWFHLTETLIRNGTDQCRAAIRAIMDDRLYRKNKKSLTAMERKSLRGAGLLDMRNLRMDALEEMVEDLLRMVRKLQDSCNRWEDGTSLPDESMDATSIGSTDASDTEQNYPFFSTSSAREAEEKSNMSSGERELAPFRPHMHASKVRNGSLFTKSTKKRIRDPAFAGGVDEYSCGSNRDKGSDLYRKHRVGQRQAKSHPLLGANRSQHEAASEKSESGAPQSPKLDFSDDSSHDIIGPSDDYRSKKNLRHPKRKRYQLCRESSYQLCRGSSNPTEAGLVYNRRPIADRMQDFLDANSRTAFCEDSPPEPHGSFVHNSDRSRSKRGRDPEQELEMGESLTNCRSLPTVTNREFVEKVRQQAPASEDEDSYIQDVCRPSFVCAERLYNELRNYSEREDEKPPLQPVGDFIGHCEDLRENYPHCPERCNVALEGITGFLEVGLAPQKSVLFLTTAFDILYDHGVSTLQELLTCKSPIIGIHIHLLVVCLRALEFRLQDGLNPNDGHAHLLFSTNYTKFVDFLVLQLCDSAYAAIHPGAWALQLQDRYSVLSVLSPIRKALARVIPLTESICRCVLEDLGCQEWRRGRSGDHIFVSSVNPVSWESFVRRGECQQQPRIRLLELGKPLPRVEVETLWTLLAFFGASKPMQCEGKSVARWQLISKLFLGVLQTESSGSQSPSLRVSDNQISSCQRELSYLVSLLSSGVLDGLPGSDGIVKNLIQKSLNMQYEKYLTESNTADYAFLCDYKSGKMVGNIWKASHPTHFQQDKYSATTSTSLLLTGYTEEPSPIQSLVLPASPMLRRCMALLYSWIQRVPPKKARQCRLSKAIEEIVRNLLDKAEQVEANNGNSFEAMFSTQPIHLPVVFLKEAASYVRITSYLFNPRDQTNNDICKISALTKEELDEVWKILANDGMIEVSEKPSTADTRYCGSSLNPLTAARVMGFLALLQMGVSPWCLTDGSAIVMLPIRDARGGLPDEAGPDTLVLSVGRLFTCLKCLCDTNCESATLEYVFSLITVVYTNAAACLAYAELDRHFRSSILHLGRISIPEFLRTLIRCYHRCTNDSDDDITQFRSLLAAFRGVLSLAAKASVQQNGVVAVDHEIPTTENTHAVDDCWGDLDDDVFAAMDLGDAQSSETIEGSQVLREAWNLFASSVELSKPSKRFAVSQPTKLISYSEVAMMTVCGKSLVARSVDRVCECLVAILVLDKDDSLSFCESFGHLLKSLTGIAGCNDDNGDTVYSINAAKHLCSSLCALAGEFQNCKSILSMQSEDVVYSLVQSLADASSLECFPSCNLRRIAENGGEQEAQRSWALLAISRCEPLMIRQDLTIHLVKLQKKRRKSAEQVWVFCRNFCVATSLTGLSQRAYGLATNSAMLDGEDGLQESTLEVGSLEMECLKRFHFLCNIISGQPDASTFERMSSLAVATAASQVLKIGQSLLYHDRACTGEKRKDPRRAKLIELLSTSSVLTIGLFICVLRDARCRGSDRWESLLNKIRDQIISWTCQHQRVDHAVALAQIIEACRSVFYGTEPRPTPINGFASISGYVGESFVIRSRQLNQIFRREHGSTSFASSLLTAFLGSDVESGDDVIAWTIAASFQAHDDILRPPHPPRFQSPLEAATNNFIVELGRDGLTEGCDALHRIKNHVMDNCLIPILNHAKTNKQSRFRALQVVSYIFKADKLSGALVEISTPTLGNLCLLSKSISTCLRQTFAAAVIDNELLAELFVCTTQVACVGVGAGDATSRTLIRWCRQTCESDDTSELSKLSLPALHATYLWIFLRWMGEVGKLIVEFVGREKKHIISFCEICRHGRSSKFKLDSREPIARYEDLLSRFETMVFPERRENTPEATNVYSKKKSISEQPIDEQMESWNPSGNLVRRTKEFMAEVIPLCYQDAR